MTHFSLAIASNTTSIPFWLQITAIAAAPILGFVGVAVGVILAERNRRNAYLLEEKKKVYLEFISTLATIHAFWANEMPSTLREFGNRNYDSGKIVGFSKPQVEMLERTFTQILFLGSQSVIDVGNECFVYVAKIAMQALVMAAKGWNEEEWNKEVSQGQKLLKDFSTVARKDLGLREVNIGNSSPRPPEVNEMITKFIHESIQAAQERLNQQHHQGPTADA